MMSIRRFTYIAACILIISSADAHELQFEATPTLRIVTSEEPPTNYFSSEGALVGTTVDIVEEIKKRLLLDVEIEVMPWARSYTMAKKWSNIVIFTAGRTEERVNHGFHFIGPVMTRKHILWAKPKTKFNIRSIDDIKNMELRLGAMRGDWREKYFRDRGMEVESVTNHKQNFRKLINGRIDLWVLSDIGAPPTVKKLGASMKDIQVSYVFKTAPSYIMLSKDMPKSAVEDWKRAYADIKKTDFFSKTAKKWSSILDLELAYSEELGLFVNQQ